MEIPSKFFFEGLDIFFKGFSDIIKVTEDNVNFMRNKKKQTCQINRTELKSVKFTQESKLTTIS